jgi:hypothetical protein
MKPPVPPDDALLWRVETGHTEVVCYVVAAPDGVVALCVERNEELMVAESYASLERAIEWSQELRAALGAIGLPDEGTTDAIATDASRRAPRVFQNPTKLGRRFHCGPSVPNPH